MTTGSEGKALVASRQKNEVLLNIESLWHEAEALCVDTDMGETQSTFRRISTLMENAATTAHHAANDTNADQSDDEDTIKALAGLVDKAATHEDISASDGSLVDTFEQTRSRMEELSKFKPPQSDDFKFSTSDYALENAFTHLVRHMVRDYIHNQVEGVIRNAIKSELDAYFLYKDAAPSRDKRYSDGKK
jgi:hypothetical protein